MPQLKDCPRCATAFTCSSDRPGCWCEALAVGPSALEALRAETAGCVCRSCLDSFASAPCGAEATVAVRGAPTLVDHLPFVHLGSPASSVDEAILWQLRAPRVVLCLLVGGMLALSGSAYQGVFRNPLAAFAGAVAGGAAAYVLGHSLGSRSSSSLIFAGVAVAAFMTAVQTFVQQRRSDTLREVYSWLLGSFAGAGWRETTTLGVNVRRVRLVIVIAATAGTAAAAAVSGLIGFVGIIVPHAIRLLVSTSYRAIVPLSFLFGTAFLVVADILARMLLSPAELPIGVVTAFFGAPFFALVLRTTREQTP